MSSKKDHELLDNVERCYTLVQQSSAKGGINAADIAKKMGKHRTTIHNYLSSLQLTGRVESHQGLWLAKKGEQTPVSLEKEITIELPLPKNLLASIIGLELMANQAKEADLSGVEETYRIMIDKERESRTIKIKGKNVDDIDLAKIGNLIQQAQEKSFKVNFKRLFKGFMKAIPNSKETKNQETPTTDEKAETKP